MDDDDVKKILTSQPLPNVPVCGSCSVYKNKLVLAYNLNTYDRNEKKEKHFSRADRIALVSVSSLSVCGNGFCW